MAPSCVLLIFSSLLFLSLVQPSLCRHSRSRTEPRSSVCSGGSRGTAGEFDIYVLAQSWSPEYCGSSSTFSKYPGCVSPTAWQKTNLTMHGLWPQYSTEQGGYSQPHTTHLTTIPPPSYAPSDCGGVVDCDLPCGCDRLPRVLFHSVRHCSEPKCSDPSSPSTGEVLAQRGGPHWQETRQHPLGTRVDGGLTSLHPTTPHRLTPPPHYPSPLLPLSPLSQHGTCSGLSQSSFFQTAIQVDLTVPTPSIISSHVGGHVTRDQLESAYNNGTPCGTGPCAVFLECDSSNRLSQVDHCFSPQLARIPCPTLVTSDSDRCRAGNVNIASFTASHAQREEELR